MNQTAKSSLVSALWLFESANLAFGGAVADYRVFRSLGKDHRWSG